MLVPPTNERSLLFLFDAIDDAATNNAGDSKESRVGCDLVHVPFSLFAPVLVLVPVPVPVPVPVLVLSLVSFYRSCR